MDFKKTTAQYYSKCLGKDDVLINMDCGIKFIFSTERNKIQYGYAQQFDLYLFYRPNRIIISYGNKLTDKIDELKKQMTVGITLESIKEILECMFGGKVKHSIKYCLNKIPDIQLKSRPLTNIEYPEYHSFFLKNNPECKSTDWLKEYFDEMMSEQLCCGLFVNDVLVSCSDVPGMPYMKNMVQEIGINTLQEHRGKGYAADVCISASKAIINRGKCPQWSTSNDNIASQRLAEKVGFLKYSDVLMITL